jgi:hypothetical protein
MDGTRWHASVTAKHPYGPPVEYCIHCRLYYGGMELEYSIVLLPPELDVVGSRPLPITGSPKTLVTGAFSPSVITLPGLVRFSAGIKLN